MDRFEQTYSRVNSNFLRFAFYCRYMHIIIFYTGTIKHVNYGIVSCRYCLQNLDCHFHMFLRSCQRVLLVMAPLCQRRKKLGYVDHCDLAGMTMKMCMPIPNIMPW